MSNEKAKDASNDLHEPIYSTLMSIRNAELAAYWARYNIQAVLNLGILTFAFQRWHQTPPLPWLVPVLGILLSIIWIFFIYLSKRTIEYYWDKCVSNYEEMLIEKDARLCAVLPISARGEKDERYNFLLKHWFNLNILAYSIPGLCLIAWFLLLYA